MDFTKSRIHPDYIGAVLMILIFIAQVYSFRELLGELFTDFNWESLQFFTTAILAFAGAGILLFTKHVDVTKTLVVSSVIFALLELYDASMDMAIGEYINYDAANFIELVLKLACSLLLIANVILYVTRRSNNLTLMMYSLGVIFCLYIIRYLDLYRMGNDFGSIMIDVSTDLPSLLLILFCILLLRSKTVKVNTLMYAIKENYRSVRRVAVPTGVRMDRSEIANLENIARNGMDCDRYEILLNSHYDADYRIVLTKEDCGIVLNFSFLDDDTGIGIARFVMKGVSTNTGDAETCDTVRIYGEDLFFIQLIAGGPYVAPPEKVPLKDMIASLIKKEDADTPEETPES